MNYIQEENCRDIRRQKNREGYKLHREVKWDGGKEETYGNIVFRAVFVVFILGLFKSGSKTVSPLKKEKLEPNVDH